MKKLLTNCPNCGAPLRHDGYCEYCDTKVRYANEVELRNLDSIFGPEPVEILFKVVRDDHTILIPFKGRITSCRLDWPETTFYANDISVMSTIGDPDVELVFNGTLNREAFK